MDLRSEMAVNQVRTPSLFLKVRRVQASFRNTSRQFSIAERALFLILRIQSSRPGKSRTASNGPSATWQVKNNLILHALASGSIELPARLRRKISIFAGGESALHSSHHTTNYLLDGTTRERPFFLHQHKVARFEFERATLFRFKYIYDDFSIYKYEQFVSEYSEEYYGRISDVFFNESSNVAIGDFPQARSNLLTDEVFSIFGQYYNNYWHFMMEYLPKITLVPGGATILVPKDLRYLKEFKAIAERMNVRILKINPNKAYTFQKLNVFTTPIKFMDSRNTSVDLDLLNNMKSELLESISATSTPTETKLFLPRTSIRRVNSDSLLQSALRHDGYSFANLGKGDFNFQRALFERAGMIVGYPGGNWANLIYAHDSSLILNFVSLANVDQSLHHALGRVFGVELRNIAICNSQEFDSISTNSYLESEFATISFDKQAVENVQQILRGLA